MKKSKKNEKKYSNNSDLDIKEPIPTPKPISSEDQKVVDMINSGHYNLNQIAGMLRIPLQRINQINDERRKTNS